MTHFTVLIKFEGDIAEAEQKIAEMLDPYDENKEVPRYKVYMSKESISSLKKHFGIKTPMSPSGVALPETELTPEQIKEYTGCDGGKDKKGYFEWSTYNPAKYDGKILISGSKWDWYSVGGRWQGMLTLKAGAKGRYVRQPNIDKNNIPIDERLKRVKGEDSIKVDIAYLKDVDFEGMLAQDIAEITESYYDAVEWLLGELEKGKTYDECANTLYFEYQIENESLEEHLARRVNFSTHAVVDEKGWHEWSKMGWWGMHSDGDQTAWNRDFMKNFLSNPTDKTVIAVVDCHI